MRYEKQDNGIKIIGKEDFNTKHILECGQIFRFEKINDSEYVVYSKDLRAKVIENSDGFFIETTNPDYFVNFFDLDTNYSEIKKRIEDVAPNLTEAIENGYGIRILKQDIFETIVSFIISANNNIKRIKLIISRLCKALGTNKGDYYAFPTVEQLSGHSEDFFRGLGLGFRARYLSEVSNAYSLLIKDNPCAMTDITLEKRLMEIKGVGQKVANCILLFGFGRKAVFPVDVWIERVYYEMFSTEKRTRPQIKKYFIDKFGDLSGYIQQYLFYSKIN